MVPGFHPQWDENQLRVFCKINKGMKSELFSRCHAAGFDMCLENSDRSQECQSFCFIHWKTGIAKLIFYYLEVPWLSSFCPLRGYVVAPLPETLMRARTGRSWKANCAPGYPWRSCLWEHAEGFHIIIDSREIAQLNYWGRILVPPQL
jgi:hypothetical protein